LGRRAWRGSIEFTKFKEEEKGKTDSAHSVRFWGLSDFDPRLNKTVRANFQYHTFARHNSLRGCDLAAECLADAPPRAQ